MKTYLYRASNLKSTITFLASVSCGSKFLATAINRRLLRFIHTANNNHHHYHHQLLQRPFFLRNVLFSLVLAVLCGLK